MRQPGLDHLSPVCHQVLLAPGWQRAPENGRDRRVHEAIARHRREKTQVSVASVARRADVSRTFFYSNPDARTAVAAALAEAGERSVQMAAAQDDEREATWREGVQTR